MKPKTGVKIGLAIMTVALVVVVAHVVPAFISARERARWRRQCCLSTLKQIGYACHQYSGEYNKEFPPGLGWLFPEYIPDGDMFVCPTARNATIVVRYDLSPAATDASAVFGPGNTDYEYVSGLYSTDPPDLVLAFDKRGNHGAGLNVLFVEAYNVQWMREEDFQAALAKTREYLTTKTRRTRRTRRTPD